MREIRFVRSAQNLNQLSKNNTKMNKLPAHNKLVKSSSFQQKTPIFRKTFVDNLKTRILDRINNAMKVKTTMIALKEKELEQEKRYKYETNRINNQLMKIAKKLNSANSKSLEKKYGKTMIATNFIKSISKIQEKRKQNDIIKERYYENKYLKVTKKIKKFKTSKDDLLQSSVIHKKEEMERRKQLQSQNYKRMLESNKKRIEKLTRSRSETHSYQGVFQVLLN